MGKLRHRSQAPNVAVVSLLRNKNGGRRGEILIHTYPQDIHTYPEDMYVCSRVDSQDL
jgi:hypothetical protein